MSQEEPKVYSLDHVTCNFNGIPIESGYGDGAAIAIEKLSPDYEEKEGADGSVVIYGTNKRLYKIMITLLQTSAGNAVLSAIRQVGLDATKIVIGPLLVRDRLSDTTIHQFSKAWIKAPANAEYTTEPTNREWELRGIETEYFVGGN